MSKAYDTCLISGSSLPVEYAEAASVYASFLEAKEEKKRESARKRKAEEERPDSMEAVETVMNLRPPAPRLSEEHFSPVSAFPPAPQDMSAYHLPAPRPRTPPPGVAPRPRAGFTTPTSATARIAASAQLRVANADPSSEQQRGLGGILTGGLHSPTGYHLRFTENIGGEERREGLRLR